MSLEQLDKEALIRILKEPKNSLIKQYKKLFEIDGVELEFEDDAVEAIAEKSLARKTRCPWTSCNYGRYHDGFNVSDSF